MQSSGRRRRPRRRAAAARRRTPIAPAPDSMPAARAFGDRSACTCDTKPTRRVSRSSACTLSSRDHADRIERRAIEIDDHERWPLVADLPSAPRRLAPNCTVCDAEASRIWTRSRSSTDRIFELNSRDHRTGDLATIIRSGRGRMTVRAMRVRIRRRAAVLQERLPRLLRPTRARRSSSIRATRSSRCSTTARADRARRARDPAHARASRSHHRRRAREGARSTCRSGCIATICFSTRASSSRAECSASTSTRSRRSTRSTITRRPSASATLQSSTSLHTPGHCPGGVCLAIGAAALDRARALRRRHAVCRIDRPDRSAGRRLRDADQIDPDVLFAFPDETIVHSGHGPDTTIGEERRTNPFLT